MASQGCNACWETHTGCVFEGAAAAAMLSSRVRTADDVRSPCRPSVPHKHVRSCSDKLAAGSKMRDPAACTACSGQCTGLLDLSWQVPSRPANECLSTPVTHQHVAAPSYGTVWLTRILLLAAHQLTLW